MTTEVWDTEVFAIENTNDILHLILIVAISEFNLHPKLVVWENKVYSY